jgi:hypothetical protein
LRVNVPENETGETDCGCGLSSACHSGAGLLEAVYELVLACELANRGCSRSVSNRFPSCIMASTWKWDFGMVEDLVIVEITSV